MLRSGSGTHKMHSVLLQSFLKKYFISLLTLNFYKPYTFISFLTKCIKKSQLTLSLISPIIISIYFIKSDLNDTTSLAAFQRKCINQSLFMHNSLDFKEIIEPLRNLFKDEVRKAGLELGIPENLVFRQPFPGPGLGIRIIGEVNADKVRIVQDADYIYRDEVDKAVAAYKKEHGKNPSWMPNQYFAALTNMRSVGVMGDERTYDYAVALRAVNTVDFMTAESAEIPFAVLQTVMSRIINEVRGVNRVFYDLTSKPPGTIEFE